jgi:segregation and condensation protein A
MDYEVKLEIFQGPMDLLLHLIRKNEVDIFDIPVAEITDQYLQYLEMLKALNINIAGDFFVMASTLIHIKSKMLLPGTDEEEEEEDPRVEIMGPLLEYLRLKEIASELYERELLHRDTFFHRPTKEDKTGLQAGEPLFEVNLFQLIDAFKRIVDQRLPDSVLDFRVQEWSLKDKTTFIIERLKTCRTLHFQQLFEQDRKISEFVVTFLALLELVHLGLIRLFQPHPDKDIMLEAVFDEENPELSRPCLTEPEPHGQESNSENR